MFDRPTIYLLNRHFSRNDDDTISHTNWITDHLQNLELIDPLLLARIHRKIHQLLESKNVIWKVPNGQFLVARLTEYLEQNNQIHQYLRTK